MSSIKSGIPITAINANLSIHQVNVDNNIFDQVDCSVFWFSMNRIISTVNTGTIRTRIRIHIMTILRDL